MVAESYDEVVFTDPTELFFSQLQRLKSSPSLNSYSQQAHFLTYSDTEDFKSLLEAKKFLEQELATVKEKLRTVDSELQQADEGLRGAQERAKAAATAAAATRKPASTAAPRAAPTANAATPSSANRPPSKKAKVSAS